MSEPVGERGQAYTGRRTRGRSAQVHERVMAAAGESLMTDGYEGLSLPRVADAAGVARSTVYRRWPTRAQLAADVLVDLNAEWVPAPTGDTLRGQLLAIGTQIMATLARPEVVGLVRGLMALPTREGEVLQQTLLASRSGVYAEMLSTARERGEVESDIDGWSLVESVIAPIWMRAFVTGAPMDDDWLVDLVDRALRGAAPRVRG